MWRSGFTPPKVRNKRMARLERLKFAALFSSI